MTAWLSPHISLEELVSSQTASRLGLDNTPSPAILAHLTLTAEYMEKVRTLLGGKPILISSGYRSPAVNASVGGSKTSAHMSGWACDFICPGFGSPLDICQVIRASGLQFDQLIEEGTWVHISFDPRMRRNVLTKSPGGGYAPGIARAA